MVHLEIILYGESDCSSGPQHSVGKEFNCEMCCLSKQYKTGVGDSGRERKRMRIFPSFFKCLCKQAESAEVGHIF